MTQQRVSPVSITSVLPATVTLSVQGALGQSANLVEFKTGTGATRAIINSFGSLQMGTINNAGAWINVQPAGTTDIGIIVRGAASQTGNLQEWQESGAQPRAYITALGFLRIRTSDTSSASIVAGPASTTQTPLIVEGLASQTGDLQIWRNSAASVIARVTASGAVGSAVGFTNSGNTGSYLDTTTNQMTVIQRVAATVAFAVRGAASQSANLQEWQDSSAVILGGMQANGQLFASQIKTSNARVFISEANSGGQTIYTRQTAAATNPGANAATLYFRDGTNAGTLKLVVRAGAAGAETTILDNIPQ